MTKTQIIIDDLKNRAAFVAGWFAVGLGLGGISMFAWLVLA